MKSATSQYGKISAVAIFGIFFGLLEAIVVIYLQRLMGVDLSFVTRPIAAEDIALNLGFIAFLKPSASTVISQFQPLMSLELWRELATMLMLACLAAVAGLNGKERLLYFFLAFGLWDLFYYVFLRVFIGWPATLADLDIYFLVPVAWVGSVITPIVASSLLIVASIFLLRRSSGSAAGRD